MPVLTRTTLALAVDELTARDADLAAVVSRHGAPPFWSRPRGFATLVYIILEQQVSLASARVTFERVGELLSDFTPEAYLELSDHALRGAGVSRQKVRYSRLLARAICDGSLPIERLGRLGDSEARQLLTSITGIGNWTADIYLMVALRRPDLWPVGDLALVKAVQSLKGLETRPTPDYLDALGDRYRPYRSVATRILWRHYLLGGQPASGRSR